MQSLIHKVIIFGVPSPEKLKLSSILKNQIPVSILSQIPNSYSEIDYAMWAYPDGIKIYDHSHKIINDSQPQFSFDMVPNVCNDRLPFSNPPDYLYSFVLTDYELNRTYCTCLNWNEKHFITNDTVDIQNQVKSKNLPKCELSLLVDNPLALNQQIQMVYIPKTIIVQSKIPCFNYQRNILLQYYNNALKPKTIEVNQALLDSFTKLINTYGYKQAEKVFDSKPNRLPQFEKKEKKIILNSKKFKSFYLSSIFLIPQTSKSTVMTENGRVITTVYNPDLPFHIPIFYEPRQLFSEDFKLFPIPPNLLIILWKCLLLQKQVLIFSHCQALTIKLCEFLLYLMSPVIWQNIYIPFLPFHLAHHVDAIGGYLIGMSHIHMNYVKIRNMKMIQNFDLKSKVVVDLKEGVILEEGGQDVLELPESVYEYLETNLTQIEKQVQSALKKPSIWSAKSLLSPKQKEKPSSIKLYVSSIIRMRKVFFNSFMLLLNNFIPFIEEKDDRIVTFKLEDYLETILNDEHKNFMIEMSKTMIFIRLCQYHRREEKNYAWVQKNVAELLFYCHDILKPLYYINNTAFSWKITDLTNQKSKYAQYLSYLSEKCQKQIIQNLQTLQFYLNAEKGIPTPSKSKWKRYGEVDEEDLFEQADKIVDNYKIQKYVCKYLKYIELHEPKRLVQKRKKQVKIEGWVSWLIRWIQPDKRREQQNSIMKKSKLGKKMSMKESNVQIMDLKDLFGNMKNSQVQAYQNDEQIEKFQPQLKKRVSKVQSQMLPLRKK